MKVYKINGQWVVWDKFGGFVIVGIGRTMGGAMNAFRNNMLEKAIG